MRDKKKQRELSIGISVNPSGKASELMTLIMEKNENINKNENICFFFIYINHFKNCSCNFKMGLVIR